MLAFVSIHFRLIFGCSRTPASIPDLFLDAHVRQHLFPIYSWMPTYASIHFRFIFGCPRTPASILDSFLDAHVRQHPFSTRNSKRTKKWRDLVSLQSPSRMAYYKPPTQKLYPTRKPNQAWSKSFTNVYFASSPSVNSSVA